MILICLCFSGSMGIVDEIYLLFMYLSLSLLIITHSGGGGDDLASNVLNL